MRSYSRSKELNDRAVAVLAGGVSSEFRKYSYPHPLFYSHGKGSRIWDVDGNEYLDFTLSQGPLILGHGHPHVLKSVETASADGQLFAGQHLLEIDLAEKLQQLIPCAELMRFSLSGSEAVHAALRTARAVTGRSKFLRFEGQYHGWLDNVALGIAAPTEEALGPRDQPTKLRWTAGLPPNVDDECMILPWNDLDLLERTVRANAGDLAAIITEPIMCNSGCIQPLPGFLEGLRRLCDGHGIALIFDEVITGFRLSLGGAQAYFGIMPDMAIFGKAMASGYPISVLAGRERWMRPIAEGTVIHAGTMNSGNPSVAAALATIEILESDHAHDHDRLFAHGQKLIQGLRAAAQDNKVPMLVQGPGPMFHVGFTKRERVSDLRDTFGYDKTKYAAFAAGMQERGVRLIGRGLWYISAAHTGEDIELALEAARGVLAEMVT